MPNPELLRHFEEESKQFDPLSSGKAVEKGLDIDNGPIDINAMAQPDDDWQGIVKSAPLATKKMSENVHKFNVLKDDKEELGFFEGWANRLADIETSSDLSEKLNDLGRRMKNGYQPDETEWEQAKADFQTLQRVERDLQKEGPTGSKIVGGINKMVWPMIEAVPKAADEFAAVFGSSVLTGAAAGAAIGTAVAPGPGTLTGAAIGAVEGASFGTTMGVPLALGFEMAFSGKGIPFIEEKIKAEEEGRPFDEWRTARTMELAASAEAVALGVGGTPVTHSMKRLGRRAAANIAAAKTAEIAAKKAIKEAAAIAAAKGFKGQAKQVAGKALQKAAHAGSTGYAVGFTTSISEDLEHEALKGIAEGKTNEEIVKEASKKLADVETYKKAHKGGMATSGEFIVLAGAMAPLEAGIKMSAAAAVKSRVGSKAMDSLMGSKKIAGAIEAAQKFKATRRSESTVRDYINETFTETRAHVDFETWISHWREKGESPREKYKDITGSYEGFDRAAQSKSPIGFSIGEFAVKLSKEGDSGAFFAMEGRSKPNEFNAREISEILSEQKGGGLREASKAAAEGVVDIKGAKDPVEQFRVYSDIMSKNNLKKYPVLHRNAFEALSEEAKAFSRTPEAQEITQRSKGLSGASLKAENPLAKELSQTALETKNGVESMKTAADPLESYDLGWSREGLVEKLGIDEVRADKIISSRVKMREEGVKLAYEKSAKRIAEAEAQRKKDILEVIPEVKAEAEKKQELISFSLLETGKTPTGKVPPNFSNIKILEESIVELFGKEYADAIPSSIKAKRSSKNVSAVRVNDLHERFGYETPEAFLDAMKEVGNLETRIEFDAAKRVEAEKGPVLKIEEVLPYQWQAMHEGRANSYRIAREADALTPRETRKIAGDLSNRSRVSMDRYSREAAREIREIPLKELNSNAYLRAMKSNARAALKSMEKGDFDAAYDYRVAELKASERHRHAIKIEDSIRKAESRAKRILKKGPQKDLAKAGESFFDSVNFIVEALGLTERSNSKILTVDGLRESLQKIKKDHGIFIAEPPIPAGGKTLPVQEYLDALSIANQIRDLARRQNKVKAFGKAMEDQMVVAEASRILREEHGIGKRINKEKSLKGERLEKGSIEKTSEELKNGLGSLEAIPFLLRSMDKNNPNGFFQNLFLRNISEARATKRIESEKIADRFSELEQKYLTKKEAKNLASKKYAKHIPEIGRTLTLEERLSYFLLSGTEHGKDAAFRYRNYTEQQQRAIIDSLEERHVRFAEGIFRIWDNKERWDKLSAAYQETTGRVPEKVEGILIPTRYGPVRGGYHPISYDRKVSGVSENLDIFASGFNTSGTSILTDGFMRRRSRVPEGAVARNDFGVLHQHMNQIAHDIAFRKPIVDAYRLASNKEMQTLFNSYRPGAGQEVVKWLEYVAQDKDINPKADSYVQKKLRELRLGHQGAMLKMNTGSALSQLTGFVTAAREVGPDYLARSLREVVDGVNKGENVGVIGRMHKEISNFDPRMRERASTGYDRDVNDFMDALRDTTRRKPFLLKIPGLTAGSLEGLKYFVGLSQMGIDTVVYRAGFMRAMEGKVKGINPGDIRAARNYAFDSVERSQGSGERIYRPRTMRHMNEWEAMFKMYFTPQLAALNQVIAEFKEVGRKNRLSELTSKEAGVAAAYVSAIAFGMPLLYDTLKGRFKGDDESWGDVGLRVATGPAELLPYVRDIEQFINHRGKIQTPVMQLAESGYQIASKALFESEKSKDKREREGGNLLSDYQFKNLFVLFGALTGQPGNEAGKIASYIRAYMQDRVGADDKEELQIFIEALMDGANKKTIEEDE